MLGRSSSWLGTRKPMWDNGAAGRRWGNNGGSLRTPLQVPGLAGWWDMKDSAARSTDTGVKLLFDKSGNSGVNALVMGPQVTGNRCSLTTGTAIGTGDFTISGTFIVPPTAVTAGVIALSASASTNNQARAVYIEPRATGDIWFTLIGATTADFRSLRVANFQSTYANQLVTVTFTRTGATVAAYVTMGGSTTTLSGSETTGGTPPAWSETVTSTNTNIGFTAATEVMAGPMTYAALYSSVLDAAGIIANAAGTVQSNNVVFVNFTAQPKLTTSFTCTSGQTVTITSSGDLGARIQGARDLYQFTTTKQPTLSGGGALFDGTDDYMKAPAFLLAQPTTVYFVGQQVSWTRNDFFLDGNTTNSMGLVQYDAASPKISIGAGLVVESSSLPVGANGVVSCVFNGASSSIGVNRLSAVTGNAGAANGNGIALGSRGDAGGNYGNINVLGVLIFSTAHDTATQSRVALWASRYYGIAGV